MRKLSYIILLTLFFSINANSQENEINNIIYKKGKISLSSSMSGGFWNDGYQIGIDIKPGIFIINKLNIGTEFGGTLSNNSIYRDLYIMPVAEYYLLDKQITPIIRAGYIFKLGNNNNEVAIYTSHVVGLGLAFMNKSGNFGVNIGADYYFDKSSYQGGFRPNISLNFYFNRKKKDNKVLY